MSASDIFSAKIIDGKTINGIPVQKVMCLVGSMGLATVIEFNYNFDFKNFKHHNSLITHENCNR